MRLRAWQADRLLRRLRGTRPALYLDVVRNLRMRQILFRMRRAVPVSLLAARTRVSRPSEPSLLAAGLAISPAPQAGPADPPHETQRFSAFGRSRNWGAHGFWEDAGDGLLFLFHLHGFAPLAEYAGGERTAGGDTFWALVIDDWLGRHKRPSTPAWHPYPTSIRIMSWSAALSAIETWPEDLRRRLALEILRQGRYLRRSVEHDIGGNHVVKNATALAFVGALFPSARLLRFALRALRREAASQILEDGGHEERSPSYHREVLTDLSDVRELLRRRKAQSPKWLDDSIALMERWMKELVAPDGRLPLLNDAWEGSVVEGQSQEPVTVLRESGYVILRHESDQLIFDAGPLCPRHLPPHAHADALSVLLWLDGEAVLIDPGSGAYTGSVRQKTRSTAAHNTVEVDGQSQCVFLGDFRAARLPRVARPRIERYQSLFTLTSAHDGYRRLGAPVDHVRMVIWWPGRGAVILDRLVGAGRHSIRSVLNLAEGGRHVGFQPIGPIRELHKRWVRHWPHLGSSRSATALVCEGQVTAGSVFGWSALRPGVSVKSCDEDHLILGDAGDSTEVPLSWEFGEYRI
jgi:uncharacterized heparinase superfamily protein